MLILRVRTPVVVVVAALSAIGLAGCASAAPTEAPQPSATADAAIEATPTPDAEPVLELGPAITGVGSNSDSAANLPVPAGAHSVSIEFTCEGPSSYAVELGDSMALQMGNLLGECGDAVSFVWPVDEETTAPLVVMTGETVSWTATPTFSSAEFRSDEAIAADCEAFVHVSSAFTNADIGYVHYQAFDELEWRDRVDDALDDLVELADDAESELAGSFAQLATEVGAPHAPVGQAVVGNDFSAMYEIGAVCNANHTPLYTLAEFGG